MTVLKEVIRVLQKIRNTKGFTLGELLIIIVILGILASIAIARFASATKETKETSLKTNLRALRVAIESYKGYSNTGIYPPNLNYLYDGSSEDINYQVFLEKIPADPFLKNNAWIFATLLSNHTPSERDNEITGEGGWAYDSVRGRICGNYKSTDNSIGTPLDTSWGIAYNIW